MRYSELHTTSNPAADLRGYQTRAVEEVRAALKIHRKVVMVLPTGAGKSIIFAEIIRLALEKGNRVLWLVHRRNLVYQMQATLQDQFDIQAGVIMAGVKSELELPVQLCTIQTYSRRLLLDDDLFNRFQVAADLVLIDEAHRSISKSYRKIIDLYANKHLIGCTATPMRADQRGLGEIYNEIVDVIGIRDLTEDGYLAPARYFVGPEDPNLDGVKIAMGDYVLKELDKRTNTPKLIGDVVDNWLRIAGGRQTIVFAVNVKHSKAIRDQFLRQGVQAYHLDARSPDAERDHAFSMMERGDVQVITNVALYQEGMDVPAVSCIVMARPTKSMGLYRQCCGRGLRPGKEDCIIIDHGGVIYEHGLLDEEIEWTLAGKERAWKIKNRKEKADRTVKCEQCGLVFEKASKCPDCGSPVVSYGKRIETTDHQLREIGKGKKPTMADKRRAYGMLLHYVEEKRKNPRMVIAKYKSWFGVWPRGMDAVAPIMPDRAFLNRMRHDYIRYAKRRDDATTS